MRLEACRCPSDTGQTGFLEHSWNASIVRSRPQTGRTEELASEKRSNPAWEAFQGHLILDILYTFLPLMQTQQPIEMHLDLCRKLHATARNSISWLPRQWRMHCTFCAEARPKPTWTHLNPIPASACCTVIQFYPICIRGTVATFLGQSEDNWTIRHLLYYWFHLPITRLDRFSDRQNHDWPNSDSISKQQISTETIYMCTTWKIFLKLHTSTEN